MITFAPTMKKLILITIIAILLSACQSYSEKKQATQLEKAMHNYELLVRWGDVEKAQSFNKNITAASLKQISNIQITSYEVVQSPVLVSEKKAVQTVLIEYVLKDSQVQRKLMDQQVWELDDKTGGWLITSDVPKF